MAKHFAACVKPPPPKLLILRVDETILSIAISIYVIRFMQSSPENDAEEVIREMVAIYDYTGQFEDELSFTAGDKIQVTTESKSSM